MSLEWWAGLDQSCLEWIRDNTDARWEKKFG
jgi:hypothetical protein